MKRLIFLALVLVSAQAQYEAKVALLNPDYDKNFSVSIAHTIFKEGVFGVLEAGTFSGSYLLEGDFRVGADKSIFFELPMSNMTLEYRDFSENEFEFGNVLIGMRFAFETDDDLMTSFIETSLRFPSTNEDASLSIYNVLADIVTPERFATTNILAAKSSYNVQRRTDLTSLFLSVGPKIIRYTKPYTDDAEFDLLIDYFAEFKFRQTFGGGVRLVGSAILTEETESVSDAFIHTLAPFIEVNLEKVNFNLEIKFILKDALRENISSIFNFGVSLKI